MPRRDNHTRLGFMAFVLGWLGYASLISAAPLKFESTPLFLAFQTESNVIFLIDDSISMNWEVITGDFVQDGRYTNIQRDGSSSGSGQVKHRDNDDDETPDCNFGAPGQSRYGYMYGVEFPTNGDPSPPTSQNCNTADDEEWRFRNSDFNPLYFNPKQTYTPWVGFDAEGKPFKNMDIHAAKDNPYDPKSLTIDLTRNNSQGNPKVVSYRNDPKKKKKPDGFRYYTWDPPKDAKGDPLFPDAQGNPLFNDGEEKEHFIRTADAATQQNFANWFSYYRKREYVVKKVYGEVIGDRSNVRVGLVTLHNNMVTDPSTNKTIFASKRTIDPNTNKPIYSTINSKVTSINIPLKSIDFDPNAPNQVNTNPAKGNRRVLLDALYSFYPQLSTPLLETLKQTGDYIENVSPGGKPRTLFPDDDAYLTVAKGGACQQSFVVLMTDGLESGSASPQVGNADNPGGADGSTDFNGGLFADTYSNTLADVAMHYYQRDLRSQLDDIVPKNQSDQARHQHMVTYTLTFQGFNGCLKREPLANESIAKFRTDRDANRCLRPNLLPTQSYWPNPTGSSGLLRPQFKMDDLRHAAFNGRGLFLQADDAAKLEKQLREALVNIAQRTSSAASVAINTGARSSTSRLYQARFDSGTWSGQLLSVKIDPMTGDPSQNPQAPDTIDSGALLDDRRKDFNDDTNGTFRTVLTYKPSTAKGIPFQWSELDTAQKDALDTNIDGKVDNQGRARLNYLRGGDADEGQKKGFRVRVHRLGDLINSDPFFVGPPALPDNVDPDFGNPVKTNRYMEFRDVTYRNRMKMILVGGNDGMLHIFNANAPFDAITGEGDIDAGQEILAYVPNSVLKNTVDLTSPSYRHRYYVDGSLAAGDVFLAGDSSWHTVAVGGLGGGGQGYFALDITDPTTFKEANAAERVLWEFTDADDHDLGFTFSQPSLVRMANGRWAAVFGNGYNNRNDTEPDDNESMTGHAVFFIVFLDGPPEGGKWVLDRDYIKIDTGVGSKATPNGLATPAVVDTKGKLTAEYLVAGDLQGNLWRVDVTSPIQADWKKPENLSLLFQTRKDVTTSTRQPITSRPEVGKHPENFGGFVVYFGTGKYLELTDNSPIGATTQTFYGIWEKPDGKGALATCSYPTPCVQDNALVQQMVMTPSDPDTPPTVTDSNKRTRKVRVTTNNPINWNKDAGQGDLGFRLDLPAPGEKQVSDSVLRSGRIIFSTLIPNDKPDQPCNPAGTSFIMALDVNGGTRLARSLFDINKDDRFDDQDQVTIDGQRLPFNGLESAVGIVKAPTLQDDAIYTSGSSGGAGYESVNPGSPPTGRQAWRKITQ